MKKNWTVCAVFKDDPAKSWLSHQQGETPAEAIDQSQQACRQALITDGSIDEDGDEPHELEPLAIAAVFEGHLYAAN